MEEDLEQARVLNSMMNKKQQKRKKRRKGEGREGEGEEETKEGRI
jgi:hypothetical protein